MKKKGWINDCPAGLETVQGLEKGKKLHWKYKETHNYDFFPWSEKIIVPRYVAELNYRLSNSYILPIDFHNNYSSGTIRDKTIDVKFIYHVAHPLGVDEVNGSILGSNHLITKDVKSYLLLLW